MEQTINLFFAVAGGKRLLEQTAQPAKIGIDLEQFPAGLLVFPTLHPKPQTDTPNELERVRPALWLDSMIRMDSSGVT